MVEAYGVFEGGGVKGIALVGALARIQKENHRIQFKGYGGTSAGAVVAALSAVGYPASDEHARNMWKAGEPAPDLLTVMTHLNYQKTFLDGNDKNPLEKILEIDRQLRPNLDVLANDVSTLWQQIKNCSGSLNPFPYVRLVSSIRGKMEEHKDRIKAIVEAWRLFQLIKSRKGIYGTVSFTEWIQNTLSQGPSAPAKVTFGNILQKSKINLKVVTTSLQERNARTYGPEKWPEKSVADAVRQSMSIPFFFHPCSDNDDYLVDGGIVSNFPTWVFDEDRKIDNAPVIGFRLIPDQDTDAKELANQDPPFGRFGAYAASVFNTILEGAQNVQTDTSRNVGMIEIKTPKKITAYRFDLSEEDRKELYQRGYETADNALNDKYFRQAVRL